MRHIYPQHSEVYLSMNCMLSHSLIQRLSKHCLISEVDCREHMKENLYLALAGNISLHQCVDVQLLFQSLQYKAHEFIQS